MEPEILYRALDGVSALATELLDLNQDNRLHGKAARASQRKLVSAVMREAQILLKGADSDQRVAELVFSNQDVRFMRAAMHRPALELDAALRRAGERGRALLPWRRARDREQLAAALRQFALAQMSWRATWLENLEDALYY